MLVLFWLGVLLGGSAVWGIDEEADSLAQSIYCWLPPSSCLSAAMSSRVRWASSCRGSKPALTKPPSPIPTATQLCCLVAIIKNHLQPQPGGSNQTKTG